MQKKLIALAVAGLAATGAYAQSNVTIYGVADGSFEQVKAGGASSNDVNATGVNTAQNLSSRTRVGNNNSYIGFKGAESLGNGLTAVFQFESNVNLGGQSQAATPYAAGSAAQLLGTGQRDTFLGLAGGFGTVAAGYLSTPTRSTLVQFDVMPGATGPGGINSLIGKVNVGASVNPLARNGATINSFGTTTNIQGLNGVGGLGATGANTTGSNNINTVARTTAIAYITPTFQGLTGTIAYVPNTAKDMAAGQSTGQGNGTATADTRSPSAWNVSLNYANGPLKAGYAYLRANDAPVVGGLAAGGTGNVGVTSPLAGLYTGNEKLATHILGASYELPMGLTLSAVYDKVTAKADLTAAGEAVGAVLPSKVSRNAWYLGAKYVMGANEFAFAYANVGDNKYTLNQGAAAVIAANGMSMGDTGAKQYTLRYAYNFSKRTQAYGIFTQVKNDRNGNFDAFTAAAPATLNAGADPKVLGVGLRHNF